MKRFWLVLLSLGLVMAFSVSAFAVDVKVSGDYFVGGLYLNKTSVNDGWGTDANNVQPSTAFFYQRLRMGTDFIVSPCLKLVTQFDAMERIWGGGRSDVDVPDAHGAGTRAEAENFSMRQVYIDYTSPIGLFKVGYMEDYLFGTVFGDRSSGPTSGQIQYFYVNGPFIGFLGYAKEVDNSYSYINYNTSVTDNDHDSYRIAGIFKFKGGEAGGLLQWERDATNKASGSPAPYLSNVFVLDPYVKAKLGPVALQAEAQYWFGDARKWENNFTSAADVSVSALSLFVDATANLGMFYAGGTLAYLSGDDPGTKDKIEGGINTGGLDWNPCLILFNTDLNYWAGNISGHTESTVDGEMSNAWFGQIRAGVKPTPQWDIMLALSYAAADKKPLNPVHPGTHIFANGDYGTEVDLTGTYKITNNLSYMLGFGYLFTGDYFKGLDISGEGYQVQDDYLLINKLTLSF